MDMLELYQQHKRLVQYVANRYKEAVKHTPAVDMEDLLQAGYIGLYNAAASYDSAKGSWTNWAVYHIRNEMQKALGRSKKEPPLSLDALMYTDSEGNACALLDFLPSGEDLAWAIADAQERSAIVQAVRHTMEERISPQGREAISRVDFAHQTMKQAAQEMGCTEYQVLSARLQAFQRMKRAPELMRVSGELDRKKWEASHDWTRGSGLAAFRACGDSCVERAVWMRERMPRVR